jgi:hypothetical protein
MTMTTADRQRNYKTVYTDKAVYAGVGLMSRSRDRIELQMHNLAGAPETHRHPGQVQNPRIAAFPRSFRKHALLAYHVGYMVSETKLETYAMYITI